MKASEISFEQMRKGAKLRPSLGVAVSYLQVEYGLKEVEGCWDGFVHTSDHYGVEFTSRKEICIQFSQHLNDYLEYIGEPVSLEVGH